MSAAQAGLAKAAPSLEAYIVRYATTLESANFKMTHPDIPSFQKWVHIGLLPFLYSHTNASGIFLLQTKVVLSPYLSTGNSNLGEL